MGGGGEGCKGGEGLFQKATFQTARANSTQAIGVVISGNTAGCNKQYSTCDVSCYGRDHVLKDLKWVCSKHGKRVPVIQRLVD